MSQSWSIKSLLICYGGGGRDGGRDVGITPPHKAFPGPTSSTLNTHTINSGSSYVSEEGLKPCRQVHGRGDAVSGVRKHAASEIQQVWIKASFSRRLENSTLSKHVPCEISTFFFSSPRIHRESDIFPRAGAHRSLSLNTTQITVIRAQARSVHTSYRCLFQIQIKSLGLHTFLSTSPSLDFFSPSLSLSHPSQAQTETR